MMRLRPVRARNAVTLVVMLVTMSGCGSSTTSPTAPTASIPTGVGSIAPALGQTIGAVFASALIQGFNQTSANLGPPQSVLARLLTSVETPVEAQGSAWSAPCPSGGSATIALPATLSSKGQVTLSNTTTTWSACAFSANNTTVVANGQTAATGNYVAGQLSNVLSIQGSLTVSGVSGTVAINGQVTEGGGFSGSIAGQQVAASAVPTQLACPLDFGIESNGEMDLRDEAVTQLTVNFDPQPIHPFQDQVQTKKFTVRAPSNVEIVSLREDTSRGFSVSPAGASIVPGGPAVEFTVTFQPKSLGSAEDTWTFVSPSSQTTGINLCAVGLSGQGVANVEGPWTGTAHDASGDVQLSFDLKQTQSTVTGSGSWSASNASGTGGFQGTVDPSSSSLSFNVSGSGGGCSFSFSGTGTLSGNQFNGSYSGSNCSGPTNGTLALAGQYDTVSSVLIVRQSAANGAPARRPR